MTDTKTSMPKAKAPANTEEFDRMKRKVEEAGPKTAEEIADMVEEMANNNKVKAERNKVR